MSFFDCVEDAINEGSADAERGRKAQAEWKRLSDVYERQGHSRHVAEVMAADEIKRRSRREAVAARHEAQAVMANARKQEIEVSQAQNLGRDAIQAVESLDYKARSLVRYADSLVGQYLEKHHPNLIGRVKQAADLPRVAKAIIDGDRSDPHAAAMADAITYAMETMRRMANEAGANIGKLDGYFPQRHNRVALIEAGLDDFAKARGISRARAKAIMLTSRETRDAMFSRSFDRWFSDIAPDLDWTKIREDSLGLPFERPGFTPSDAVKREYLLTIYRNIVYGPDWDKPTYGKTQGAAVGRRMSQERVLHFKDADAFIRYNSKYGSGDIHQTIMSHMHHMARDIVAMREFGPNPHMGLSYRAALIEAEAVKRGINPGNIKGKNEHAARMLRAEQGAGMTTGYGQTLFANFMSDTRAVLTSAFLDRAILASIPDLALSKSAAQTIGAGRDAAFPKYIKAVADMVKEGKLTTQEMRQWQWITDTMADPGSVLARFNGDHPSSAWAQNLSSFVMKAQGLSQHTDAGRFALYQVFSGQMATQIGRKFADIEPGLLAIFKERGITARDWDMFATPEGVFRPDNGAEFLNPLYWRRATTLADDVADEIYLKFGAAAEDFIELGVPTQSLFMRGFVDPTAYGLAPGTPLYELGKSALMFKSFVMAYSYNMYRATRRMPGSNWSKAAWAAETIAGATVMGAVSLQLFELIKGNDPLAMDNAQFWGLAAAKGGGFAVIGDLVVAGETKWQGGFGSYIMGPVPQVAGDAWNLTVGNLIEIGGAVMTGQPIKTDLPKELSQIVSRYLPGGDLPYFGPAKDRLIADQLFMLLDPDAYDAIIMKSKRRENLNGNKSFWMPGSALPARAPDLGSALGRLRQ